jgi:hypothetical protein
MKLFWSWLVIAHASAAFASIDSLLPRPQETTRGGGTLKIGGLAIGFSSTPKTEDLFVAEQLAEGIEKATGIKVPVQKDKPHGKTIVLNRKGDIAALPVDGEKAGSISREAYELNVTSHGVEITARGSAGVFYGAQTLLQLIEGAGRDAVLPVVGIRDWPTLSYRGVMIDFSEGELLRVSELERQLDLMAKFKVNQLYFYTEASIEFRGYEVVNPTGRYTRDEVRHIIDYARQRHIDVIPCMELYGHMHNLFRYEKYADWGLPRYGGEYDPRNPKMFEILDNWIDQTADLFPSPWYHVGFDEPWSLGKIGVVPGKDPFKTFMDVLRHISEKASARGKRTLFWADINEGASTLSKHPELLKDIPQGVIACPWVYEAETNYTPWIEPLAADKVPTMVAPGVWGWNELWPDYHRSFVNINDLIAAGRRFNTLGVINTTWTDSRQTIYRQVYPGIAFGAAASWQSRIVNTNSFFSDYCAAMYPAPAARAVAKAMAELSDAEQKFETVLKDGTQYSFWADPLAPGQLKKMQSGQAELRQARILAEDADVLIQHAMKVCDDPNVRSMLVAARQFQYLGMKCLYALEWAKYFDELKANPRKELVTLYIGNQMNSTTYGMLTDLREMISELREQYRDAWLDEAMPFRLQSALYRWDAEWDYWTAVQKLVVQKVLHSWKEGEPFPAIDVIRPK